MRSLAFLALVAAVPTLAQTPSPSTEAALLVSAFSSGRPGTTFPSGWIPVKINDQKKLTTYDLVDDNGTVVLHAIADGAASLLGHRVALAVC